MCGISGTINIEDKGDTALQMARIIKHRGPDEGPVLVVSDRVAMCAVRLAIVDVANGAQPMADEYGNIVAQNGEIYNHRELRNELKKQGHVFRTECDTEVLLAGFASEGPGFVEKLDGIFAISYYEKKTKKLYLFRDYFGVKPLYYVKIRNGIEYSSEIKSFWHDNQKFEISLDYLIFNNVFNWSHPDYSLYQNILPVRPGSYIEIDEYSRIEQYSYEPIFSKNIAEDYEATLNMTRNNLISAVQSQIPHEVSWGMLLSGGVDSSILGWIAKQEYPGLRTFSVCSEDVDSEDILSAREIASFLKTDHTEIRVNLTDTLKDYADYLYTIEDVNSRFYFYYFISKYLQDHVKVAMCGEGADELYMGYPVYRNLEDFASAASSRWDQMKELAGPIEEDIENLLLTLRSYSLKDLYSMMIKHQLPWFQLNPVDKCSMRFGVELRVPYLSLIHALPVMNYSIEDKLSGDIEKNILRSAFKYTMLPTLWRKKFFAGTRTLPTFYMALNELAENNFSRLVDKYPREAQVLNKNDLYSLSLLDEEMRKESVNTIKRIRNNEYARAN